ncbi:MAG: YncE family protein [Bryobacteraceae bacterium]
MRTLTFVLRRRNSRKTERGAKPFLAGLVVRAALFALTGAACSGATGYHLVKTIPVPGDGGFDYLTMDSAARRLYVSHGTEVNVLDADSRAIAGKIPDTRGVHGIAIAPESGRGFITDGQANTVTIFNLKTLARIADVPAGTKPDGTIYDPATRRVFAFNGGSDNTTVIDAATGKVAGTIALGGAPEFAASDGAGHVYVNLENKSETLKLDSRKLTVLARWAVAPCEAPSAMAMDVKSRRLFVGCGNRLAAVLNADSGKVIGTFPIGDHVDAAGFDPATGLAFFSCGDGTLTLLHENSADSYGVVDTVKTLPGAKTMALDLKTHRVFLSTADRAPRKPGAKGRGSIVPGSFKVLVVGKD